MAISTTCEDILNCARGLIMAGGYNGFSYAHIAKAIGIRNASIHHHFPSKADLVHTLVARYREEAESGIAKIERHVSDPLGLLRAYTGYWETCIADATAPICVCALLASQISILPDDIAHEVRAHFRSQSAWLTSVLERGATHGQFRLSRPAKTEAEAIMATVHGAMLSARAYGDPKIFADITGSLLERLAPKA